MYCSIVVSLMYIATRIRPDLAAETSTLALYTNEFKMSHIAMEKRVLRYLNCIKTKLLVLIRGQED